MLGNFFRADVNNASFEQAISDGESPSTIDNGTSGFGSLACVSIKGQVHNKE